MKTKYDAAAAGEEIAHNILVIAILGLLLAFPIKWAWNYTMPYLFDWKILSWGQAWCLNFLMGCLVRRMPPKSD